LNFTEKLVENLYESQNSWNLVNEKFEAFKTQYEFTLKQREEGLEVDQASQPIDLNDSQSEDFKALRAQLTGKSKAGHDELADSIASTP
jgi:hypothetical protein